jgi:hypothetical protein
LLERRPTGPRHSDAQRAPPVGCVAAPGLSTLRVRHGFVGSEL